MPFLVGKNGFEPSRRICKFLPRERPPVSTAGLCQPFSPLPHIHTDEIYNGIFFSTNWATYSQLSELAGLEPATFCFPDKRSNHYMQCRMLVGEVRLELTLPEGDGFTVRCDTNYATPPYFKRIKTTTEILRCSTDWATHRWSVGQDLNLRHTAPDSDVSVMYNTVCVLFVSTIIFYWFCMLFQFA